jgi:hypothetical protein
LGGYITLGSFLCKFDVITGEEVFCSGVLFIGNKCKVVYILGLGDEVVYNTLGLGDEVVYNTLGLGVEGFEDRRNLDIGSTFGSFFLGGYITLGPFLLIFYLDSLIYYIYILLYKK